ncbi:hypothetical protein PYCC9005_004832 [Savitreella phatthalungensis]
MSEGMTTAGTPPPPLIAQKMLATSGSSQAASLSISLAEPVLFLTGGFDTHEPPTERPTMLRGTLMVKLNKPSKIKAISLQFVGKSRTEWPEGIPPKKQEFWEEKELMNHTWTFFNAQFPIHEHSHGAAEFRSYDGSIPSTIGNDIAENSHAIRPSASFDRASLAGGSGLLPFASAKSFSKNDGATTQMKGYRLFAAGEYLYNFELPIPSFLPESITCDMGRVFYELRATIDRAGAFKSNLAGSMAVELIRTPGEANMESSEPIAISRNWEDQLHYDIIISGKSFPLGSKIPIAFKLTPLAKVRVHRIKVFVTETVEYWCKNKKVHRLEPTRKILLLEKNAGVSGGAHESLLGNIDGASNAGSTEFELDVKLPGCDATGKEKLHFDTTFQNIKVHHWIKVVMRLSKADPQPNDPQKRRHFEISIDSPVHMLSCRCTNASTQLPSYQDAGVHVNARLPCPCGQTTHEVSTIQRAGGESSVGSNRPMHLLRQPSSLPPPFTADVAPPPLMTPPPGYDYTPGQRGRVLDYFQQLEIEDGSASHRELAADDSEVGRRTPGLHPALLTSPASSDPRARRGSAIELNGSIHGPPSPVLSNFGSPQVGGISPVLAQPNWGDSPGRNFYSRGEESSSTGVSRRSRPTSGQARSPLAQRS